MAIALGWGFEVFRKHVDEGFLNTTEPVLPEGYEGFNWRLYIIACRSRWPDTFTDAPFMIQAELVSSLP